MSPSASSDLDVPGGVKRADFLFMVIRNSSPRILGIMTKERFYNDFFLGECTIRYENKLSFFCSIRKLSWLGWDRPALRDFVNSSS
jgi:hypothetical protein